jgi:hypothetical protein
MPPLPVFLLGCALLGALTVAGTLGWLRRLGADLPRARRLGGARQLGVADVLDLQAPPTRPVRVAGRVRCPDPLVTPDDERLVAFHRDVEVQAADGRWRTIERLRETRSFALWDHGGSLTVDPALASEPLIAIPLVWEGAPEALEEPHASAVARLRQQGAPPIRARAVTRTISVVDHLLVLARVALDQHGAPQLQPPDGGFVISSLELDDAMRLLGGRHRGALPVALGLLIVGSTLVVVGLLAAAIAALARV